LRFVSALLATLGVAVAVSGRINGTEFRALPIVFAFIAGAVIAVQQAINGRLGVIARNSFSATWFNFFFGTTALCVTAGVLIMRSEATLQSTAGAPWWSYVGGPLGIIFIATSVWVVPRIGVLLFALVSISGQLSGAVILDVVAPTEGTELGAQLFIGVGITGLAIVLSTLPRLLKSRSR
jgi:transporter family-2 protein